MVDKLIPKTIAPIEDELIDPADPKLMRRYRRDIKEMGSRMGRDEVRFMVATFYQHQRDRIRTGNRISAYEKAEKNAMNVMQFFNTQSRLLEELMKYPLEAYVNEDEVGKWLISLRGIGPLLAAGLLAYLDIERAPVASSFWRYAGFDPSVTWGKGQKRPFNGNLKTHCYKVGLSLIMSGNQYYKPLYVERKAYETNINEKFGYRPQAEAILARMRMKRDDIDTVKDAFDREIHDMDEMSIADEKEVTEEDRKTFIDTLKSGKLSAAHIDMRARRWMIKLFLAHLHRVMYETHHRMECPLPYPIAHMNHAHEIPPPDYVSPYRAGAA